MRTSCRPSDEEDRSNFEQRINSVASAERILGWKRDRANSDQRAYGVADAARKYSCPPDIIERPRCYSVIDAARMLGCSRSHLYQLNKGGRIRFAKLLGKTVVTASEIDRVVAALEHEGGL